MIAISRRLAALSGVAIAATFAAPASAQYANEYVPPKLVQQGTTSVPIAGNGTVIVQVEVAADGSHRVIRVIKSTNSADNPAAMDIAQHSTYRVGRRGTKPITAFYDFTLKFKGKSVATTQSSAPEGGGEAAQIARLINMKNYSLAKSRAQSALASNPNDPMLNAQLGAIDFLTNDYASAVAAFDKTPTPPKEYTSFAVASYYKASQQPGVTPTQQVAYLQKAHDLVMADPTSVANARLNITFELAKAYQAAGETAQYQKMAAEIKQMAPNSTQARTLTLSQSLDQAIALSNAGKHEEALAAFQQAAQGAPPQVQVTAYARAAFEQNSILVAQKTQPTAADYAKVKALADKALAIDPNFPAANFAEGIALYEQYAAGGNQDANLKSQAVASLNKAKSQAQAQGNNQLVLQINNFMSKYIK